MNVSGMPSGNYVKSICLGNENLLDNGLHVAGSDRNSVTGLFTA